MNVELDKFCPYAPHTSVLTVIRHIRDRELKEPVTSQLITTIGVSEGNASRTIAALRFLKLLDEEGYITPNFREIENAPDDEYPGVLGRIINDAYEHVFMALDPATASDDKFVTAFRYYLPKAQRPRMIMLFRGLCREAGIISGGAPEMPNRPRMTTNKSSKSPLSPNGAKWMQSEPKDAIFESEPTQVPTSQTRQSVIVTPITSTEEYAIMQGVLHKLPFVEKTWTQAQRDKWLKAVAANVDMLFELKDPDTGVGKEEEMYRS
jgi:hypothetical protein